MNVRIWLRKNKDKNENKRAGGETQESVNLGDGYDSGEVLKFFDGVHLSLRISNVHNHLNIITYKYVLKYRFDPSLTECC